MRALQISILWIMGILLWVFDLSIGLAWYKFGYLDLQTVATMGAMLFPVLAVAIGILVWSRAQDPVENREPARPQHTTSMHPAC